LVNTAGNTSVGYFGLTWRMTLLELGYRITPTLSVAAYFDHMSNANLAA
jgi:hypothetical protein